MPAQLAQQIIIAPFWVKLQSTQQIMRVMQVLCVMEVPIDQSPLIPPLVIFVQLVPIATQRVSTIAMLVRSVFIRELMIILPVKTVRKVITASVEILVQSRAQLVISVLKDRPFTIKPVRSHLPDPTTSLVRKQQ